MLAGCPLSHLAPHLRTTLGTNLYDPSTYLSSRSRSRRAARGRRTREPADSSRSSQLPSSPSPVRQVYLPTVMEYLGIVPHVGNTVRSSLHPDVLAQISSEHGPSGDNHGLGGPQDTAAQVKTLEK